MWVRSGERFEQSLTLDAEAISDFARRAGDFNPLHHDPAVAAASRFGTLIASATHYNALFMGMVATWFSERVPVALGLEFNLRLKGAVRADEPLNLCWTITGVQPKPHHRGAVVSLEGRITGAGGEVKVDADAKILVTDHPESPEHHHG